MRIAVLASGGGSNLQALLDRFDAPDAVVRIALVIASRPDAGAVARARSAGVPVRVLPPGAADHADQLLLGFTDAAIDFVVLAGWLARVPTVVVAAWRDRMLNIHPSLLPAFGGPGMYGTHVHRAVLAAGARVSGATVHWVDEEFDTGRIAAQWPVPVLPGDTPERLAARVLAVEHCLLPAVVERLAAPSPAEDLALEAAFVLAPLAAPPVADIRSLLPSRLRSAAHDAPRAA